MCLLTAETGDSFLQFITVLLLFLFVLFITWFTTRWIAGYQKGKAAGSNLEMIESMHLAGNKYLQIVRAGETYLVIASGKEEVHMLATLREEELNLTVKSEGQETDFKKILEKFGKQNAKEDD